MSELLNCKTCDTPLETSSKYCSNCGGKIVTDRLSLKGTWNEFVGPFFNWENHFWRTFGNLFSKPQDVLAAYISGARKKYFQPFSFLILFATIALLFYKLFPLSELTDFTNGFQPDANANGNNQTANPFTDQKAINEFIFNYYNLFLILSIPVIALVTFLTFKKRANNFAEHLVFQAYIQSILGYLIIILQVFLIHLLKLNFNIYMWSYFIIAVGYSNYVFTKYYHLNLMSILIANLKFTLFGLIIFSIIMIVFVLAVVAFMFITKGAA